MKFGSFKRHNFFDILKKKSIINLLTNRSLIVKNIILKNFTISDVSTPDDLRNNSIAVVYITNAH